MNSKLSSSNMIFPNSKQFRETCMSQEFPIPMPIMKYIWTNPSSPKIYQKLIQCCKIFFIKHPILVIRTLWLQSHDTKKWSYCDKTDCNGCRFQHKKIEMDKITDKIWVTNVFKSDRDNNLSNIISILPKMFRQEIEVLDVHNYYLSYKGLVILSKVVKKIWIRPSVIYENGEFVPLKTVIRIFSKNTKVCINFWSTYHAAFGKNYDDLIEACNSVKEVYFHEIPNSFDISEFYRNLKMSKSPAVFTIVPTNTLPRVPFDEVIDEILHTKSFEFVPPVINYYGLDDGKLQKMRQIREIEAKKFKK